MLVTRDHKHDERKHKQCITVNKRIYMHVSISGNTEIHSSAVLSLRTTVHAIMSCQAATENDSNSGNESETAEWDTKAYSSCLKTQAAKT